MPEVLITNKLGLKKIVEEEWNYPWSINMIVRKIRNCSWKEGIQISHIHSVKATPWWIFQI